MRAQWCRENIDKVAEQCGLEKTTVYDVKQAARFCVEHSAFAECSTHAIRALIRVPDEPVRERAISLAETALMQQTPTGGKKKPNLTEREVRKIISRAELEVRKELADKITEERRASGYTSPPMKAPAGGVVSRIRRWWSGSGEQ